eukprot:13155087-Alexandrium_andersonii.AAC.1
MTAWVRGAHSTRGKTGELHTARRKGGAQLRRNNAPRLLNFHFSSQGSPPQEGYAVLRGTEMRADGGSNNAHVNKMITQGHREAVLRTAV